MMQQLFRKLRRKDSSQPFTQQRIFTHERLEPRMMLTINPTGAEFLVNDIVPGFQAIEANVSSVAVSEAVGTIAAYSGLGAGARESIFVRRFGQDGTAQGEAVRASTTIRGTRTSAVVAANAVGNSVVVWQGRGLGDKYGIFLQRFDVSGAKAGTEQLVNQTIGGTQDDPSVAMATDGSFVVSWSGPNGTDPAGVFARRYNADGTPASSEELVNTTTADLQIESSIAVNGTGDYVVTWSSKNQDGDEWGVFGQRFNAAGVRQGGEFAINTATAASQRESSVALQDDGTFMVIWSSFGQDGDSWAVVAQRFDAAGSAVGGEFVVNTLTTDHQRHAQVAGAGGKYLVTWQSGVADGRGWEVMAQEFDAAGVRIGGEQAVNSLNAGTNSGHQEHPAVALNSAGSGAVVWSGFGTSDRQGVFGRGFQDDTPAGPNLTPDLATISDQTVGLNGTMTLTVTATDPNAGDTLTYQLDPTDSPATAEIVKIDNNTARITWTPTSADANSVVNFRVLVTDNGVPPLADTEEFRVVVADGGISLDLNGADEPGSNSTAHFAIGLGPASILADDLLIVGVFDDKVNQVIAQLAATPDGTDEVLEADSLNTDIVASYDPATRRLLLSGTDTAENYERVLKTLRYNNTAANPSGTRTVEVQVIDAILVRNKPTITIDIGTADLVGFAEALSASNTEFFGAAFCPFCTAQKELFEDGGQFLPFTEVTNPDRTLNEIGIANGITTFPTWVFPDGSRLEGVQSLETLAARSRVPIPVSDNPTIAPIANETLLIGSPLHVPLDGYDPNGGPLTYTVTTSNSAVEATILENTPGNTNRSARVNVAGYGDLVFELFEQRASRPTERFIDLANSDFFDDVIFHRIDADFVIQGGRETATGVKDSGLMSFDDQFHVDLQHNREGLLSYAKTPIDDSNGSESFITNDGSASLRNLDFNHSIFAILVEGEGNRQAIRDTALVGERPVFDIAMENVKIFQDDENAVLMLKAAPGTTGDVTVTVTATDGQGHTFERSFTVTVEEDTIDGRPFLDDIPPVATTVNTPVDIQLVAIDAEGAAEAALATFDAMIPAGSDSFTFVVSESGLVTVTPPPDFVGILELLVAVFPSGGGDFDSQRITIEVI